MMYAELYQYLLQHKKLSVPGIGTFLLERKPATIDFGNKLVNPPFYFFSLQAATSSPSRVFFNWLASVLNISDLDAIIRFNDFTFEMKKQVAEGALINWKGVGEIKKGLAGEIKFTPSGTTSAEEAVPAIRVLREKAEHSVRVGEEQKTSTEMVEMLSQPEEKRSYWWAWGLVLGLLSVLFIGWYFSENGLDSSATANGKKLVLPEQGATYKLVP